MCRTGVTGAWWARWPVGLDLRLGAEVAEVAISAGGVRVRGADGSSEEGSHVVVTVPLNVLKRARRGSRPGCRRTGWRLPHLMLFPRDPAEWVV